jgi:hypothetical protein
MCDDMMRVKSVFVSNVDPRYWYSVEYFYQIFVRLLYVTLSLLAVMTKRSTLSLPRLWSLVKQRDEDKQK